MEQNREVFAVPGNITSRNSFGTNYLIKGAGAKLVQTWQDIVSELPSEIAASMLPPPPSTKTDRALIDQLELVPGDLTPQERVVWKLLSVDDPVHIDALVAASGFQMPELTNALLALEMRELIRQLPGKCFVRRM